MIKTGNILRITDILKILKIEKNIKPTGFIHGKYKIICIFK